MPSGTGLSAAGVAGAGSLWLHYVESYPLAGGQLKFNSPLKLEISPGEDVPFKVFAPLIDTGGTGESVPAAIEDLLKTALEVRAAIRGTPTNKRHPSAQTLLSKLEQVIAE